MRSTPAIAGALLLFPAVAFAGRPTTGGAFINYDDTDVVEYVDGPDGLVRVFYSTEGTNQTRLDDDDANGVPDFPEEVAATAEDVLETYEALGFRLPVHESDVGLGDLGGSDAFDFYLVDFGGSSDGMFAADGCSGVVCAGHMLMENDFRGYGYSSISTAIKVLTSHEQFHAVQAAYNADQPGWVSEGTAVWAEFAYDPGNEDFFWFCDEYLEDTGRSLDRPPAGAISSFVYSTALFWAFLEERVDTDALVALQEGLADEGRDVDETAIDVVDAVFVAAGSSLAEEWPVFARWNLATGDRAGEAASYPWADELQGVTEAEDGAEIHDDNRFYPLATTYYRLDHAGGDLLFGNVDDATGVVFSLHAVADGDDDGPVSDAVASWEGGESAATVVGSFDEGGYWLVGTYPQIADQSVKVEFCLGGVDAMADCGLTIDDEVDTGDGGEDDGRGGCACATAAQPTPWLALWLPLLVLGRRRGR